MNYNIHPLALSAKHYLLAEAGFILAPLASTGQAITHVTTGGALAGGAATVTRYQLLTKTHVAAGGALAGGSAGSTHSWSAVPVGGAITGGSAGSSRGVALWATGGAIAGGAAVATSGRAHVATGGAVAGGWAGQASSQWIFQHHMASGGALAGGAAGVAAILLQIRTQSAIGGALAGGRADTRRYRWRQPPSLDATLLTVGAGVTADLLTHDTGLLIDRIDNPIIAEYTGQPELEVTLLEQPL